MLYFNLNFVFLCFLFFVFPSFFLIFLLKSEVNQNWFWIQFCISFILMLFHVISLLFHLSFLLPSFPFLVLSFRFPFIFFNCPFCSTFLCLFLSWSSRCSNVAISLRSDNLAITFCWKRNPGRGIDSFDPNKKNSTKKRTGSQP